jgi:hypothetical protein
MLEVRLEIPAVQQTPQLLTALLRHPEALLL